MTRKYCITGKAGSGKDTAGEYLAGVTGQYTYALATPIKHIISGLFDVSLRTINDRRFKEAYRQFTVLPDSLEYVATLFSRYGLDKYQELPEAWEQWQEELDMRYDDVFGTYYLTTSPRKLMQYFGTEWGRALDDEIWLNLAPEEAVITDIRMENEAQYFLDRGYTLIEVVRPSQKEISASGHVTEAGLCRTKFEPTIVFNDMSIPELYDKLRSFL